MQEKFYHYGKYFENEEEFWAHVKQWTNECLTEETAEIILERFKKDLFMNIFLMEAYGCREINNSEFNQVIEEAFLEIIRKVRNITGQDASQSINHKIQYPPSTQCNSV